MRKVLTFLGIALILSASAFLFTQRNNADDLRIELPKEYRNLIIGGGEQISTDFGLSSYTEPTMFIFGTNGDLQAANQQGWRDFYAFTGLLGSTDSAIQNVYNYIISLQSEKAEIIDDAERLTEITKIIDIHPDYSMTEIVAKLATFETLKNYLIDNGYIGEE